MEQMKTIKNKINEAKLISNLICSDSWKNNIDPILEGEFEKNISMALVDKEKQLEYLSNARAIFNLCNKIGNKISLGNQAKKQLLKLKNKGK